jgi:hypothetical protein
VASAAWLRVVWVPPHHAMYVDEPWYLEAARNLLERGALVLCQRAGSDVVCAPYPKAAGWPVILAGAFALLGSSSTVAFAVSAILSTTAVLLAGVVVRLAGGGWHQAAFAAVLVAVHPLHVAWSATAETNAASTGVLLAGITGVFLLRRRASLASAALAAGGLGLAAAMRPELATVTLPALVVLFTSAAASWRDALIVGLGGVMGASSIIASWPLYVANSSGSFLGLGNLAPNFARLLGNDEGGPVTIMILALAAVGTIMSLKRRMWATLVLLGGGALLAALVAIGYDQRIFYPRTALGSLALLAPLAALALPALGVGAKQRAIAHCLAAGACMLAVALAVPGLQRAAQLSDAPMLETRLPLAVAHAAVPADAIVIAEWPTVLAAETDVIPVAAGDLLAQDNLMLDGLARAIERRPHLLLCDMFCEPGFAGSNTPSPCARILAQFEVEEVTAVADPHRRYGLYRLLRRAGPEGSRAPCPSPPKQDKNG